MSSSCKDLISFSLFVFFSFFSLFLPLLEIISCVWWISLLGSNVVRIFIFREEAPIPVPLKIFYSLWYFHLDVKKIVCVLQTVLELTFFWRWLHLWIVLACEMSNFVVVVFWFLWWIAIDVLHILLSLNSFEW